MKTIRTTPPQSRTEAGTLGRLVSRRHCRRRHAERPRTERSPLATATFLPTTFGCSTTKSLWDKLRPSARSRPLSRASCPSTWRTWTSRFFATDEALYARARGRWRARPAATSSTCRMGWKTGQSVVTARPWVERELGTTRKVDFVGAPVVIAHPAAIVSGAAAAARAESRQDRARHRDAVRAGVGARTPRHG